MSLIYLYFIKTTQLHFDWYYLECTIKKHDLWIFIKMEISVLANELFTCSVWLCQFVCIATRTYMFVLAWESVLVLYNYILYIL